MRVVSKGFSATVELTEDEIILLWESIRGRVLRSNLCKDQQKVADLKTMESALHPLAQKAWSAKIG